MRAPNFKRRPVTPSRHAVTSRLYVTPFRHAFPSRLYITPLRHAFRVSARPATRHAHNLFGSRDAKPDQPHAILPQQPHALGECHTGQTARGSILVQSDSELFIHHQQLVDTRPPAIPRVPAG